MRKKADTKLDRELEVLNTHDARVARQLKYLQGIPGLTYSPQRLRQIAEGMVAEREKRGFNPDGSLKTAEQVVSENFKQAEADMTKWAGKSPVLGLVSKVVKTIDDKIDKPKSILEPDLPPGHEERGEMEEDYLTPDELKIRKAEARRALEQEEENK